MSEIMFLTLSEAARRFKIDEHKLRVAANDRILKTRLRRVGGGWHRTATVAAIKRWVKGVKHG